SLGISNSNYKVTLSGGTELLLKVSNDKDREQLIAEQSILSLLAELGYPHSLRAYSTKNDEVVYEYGQFFGVLYPFIDGIQPRQGDVTCAETGRALARLHKHKFDSKIHLARTHEEVGFGPNRIKEYVKSGKAQSYFIDCYQRV